MKKKIGNIAILLVIAFCVIVIGFLSGCHEATKELGGSMTIELEPGQKLEEITWKETSLWYLTRPFRDGEEPEIHTFQEDAEWGVMEGTVTIIESK